jgi:5'-nucleotidase
MVNQFIGVAAQDITRTQNSAGEDAMGDMVADGQRAAMKTEVGFDTSGDIRADLSKGNITWGNLYAVQPFADTVQSMTLTGEQVRTALEQQWQEPLPPHNLAVSGLVYTWDEAKPAGSKVTSVTVHGVPLDPKAVYTVSMISYLSSGGDGYTTFTEGKNITNGPVDVDAFVAYVGSLPQPVNVTVDGRIQRTN